MLITLKNYILSFPRLVKQTLAILADIVMCAASVWLALDLRLETHAWPDALLSVLFVTGLFLFLPIFIVLGLYKAIFRYAGLQVIFTLNKAMTAYGLLYATIFTVWGVDQIPRSLGLLQPLIFGLFVATSRLTVRYLLGGMNYLKGAKAIPKVLIYGAGSAGRQLVNGLSSSSEVEVVGFVDDDDRLHGHNLNGLTIYGLKDLQNVVKDKLVTQIYLAMPSVSQRRRNEVINALRPLHLLVRTLPGLTDLVSGKILVSDLRELNIEDLLGREPVAPNPLMLSKKITGKVVMVTGAGGTIGSELCRQILKSKPHTLLMVEMTEYAIYDIHRELQASMQGTLEGHPAAITLVPLLGNVRDAVRMAEILRTWRPSTVYHAAAYKHVPLVEHNPAEGVKNNVQGTLITALQSALYGVNDFVLISTDKAVRPTNIMGTSKRLAEMVLQAKAFVQTQKGGKTRFSIVRFGNVLGSSGSVFPLFREQIANGGPITLTDERITRYFMTIPEAAQLVIQAAAMAQGGEVFVLDMGEPVKILDLAKRMVELSGLTVMDDAHPDGDIEIKVTGLRPGEKLYEELLIGDNPMDTSHVRIMKAHEDFLPWDELQSKLNILNGALDVNNIPLVRTLLKDLVPGYQPDEAVVDWVWIENEKQA